MKQVLSKVVRFEPWILLGLSPLFIFPGAHSFAAVGAIAALWAARWRVFGTGYALSHGHVLLYLFRALQVGTEDVGLSDTTQGFHRFTSGETDISDASRPIGPTEVEAARIRGIEYLELKVGLDKSRSRPVFIYVNKESLNRPEVLEFGRFYLTQGPEMIAQSGYSSWPGRTTTRLSWLWRRLLDRINQASALPIFGSMRMIRRANCSWCAEVHLRPPECWRTHRSVAQIVREAMASQLMGEEREPKRLPFAALGRSGRHDTASEAETIPRRALSFTFFSVNDTIISKPSR